MNAQNMSEGDQKVSCVKDPVEIENPAKVRQIAIRKLNKHRRIKEYVPMRFLSDGQVDSVELECQSWRDLYIHARQLDIDGRGDMTKEELVWAIRQHQIGQQQ